MSHYRRNRERKDKKNQKFQLYFTSRYGLDNIILMQTQQRDTNYRPKVRGTNRFSVCVVCCVLLPVIISKGHEGTRMRKERDGWKNEGPRWTDKTSSTCNLYRILFERRRLSQCERAHIIIVSKVLRKHTAVASY